MAENKQQPSQTAVGTGLSGARHVQGAANALGGGSDDSSAAGAAAAAVDGGESKRGGVREELDALVDRVKGLRKRTAEATLFLTVYDIRRAQEVCMCGTISCVLRRLVLTRQWGVGVATAQESTYTHICRTGMTTILPFAGIHGTASIAWCVEV